MFKGNRIYKIDKYGNKKRVLFIPGINIRFKGRNSSVTVREPITKFKFCTIKLASNSHCFIGSSPRTIKKLKVFLHGDNCVCKIGDGFSCTNYCELQVGPEQNMKIEIGDNCMFGRDILIRATDGHAIRDVATGKVVNYGGKVSIGNHVWLAEGVSVLKGCNIADNCVVGLKSIVTKDCATPNAVYVGAPAKLVKTGINWEIDPPR